MAKRLTDTDKWKRPWFRALNAKAKLVWIFLLDQCDHAGIWLADFEVASLQLGFKLTDQDLQDWFGVKVCRVDHDKYFVPGFFEFQYAHAKEGFRAKQSAIAILTRMGLLDEAGTVKELLSIPSETVPEQLADTPEQSSDCLSISISKSISKKGGVGGNKLPVLAEVWNQNRGVLSGVLECKGSRKKHADARWNEAPDLAYWGRIVQRMAASPFCQGKNNTGWRADFDFLIKPDTAAKVLEGKYDDRKAPGNAADDEYQRLLKQYEAEKAAAEAAYDAQGGVA